MSNIKINEYIKSEKGKRQMNTIKSAFVTFQTEEGHDEARNYINNPRQYQYKNSVMANYLRKSKGK